MGFLLRQSYTDYPSPPGLQDGGWCTATCELSARLLISFRKVDFAKSTVVHIVVTLPLLRHVTAAQEANANSCRAHDIQTALAHFPATTGHSIQLPLCPQHLRSSGSEMPHVQCTKSQARVPLPPSHTNPLPQISPGSASTCSGRFTHHHPSYPIHCQSQLTLLSGVPITRLHPTHTPF